MEVNYDLAWDLDCLRTGVGPPAADAQEPISVLGLTRSWT